MVSLLSGILFSIGLVISGMINPVKVIGFLDIFRSWDYSLAFVMGGAIVFNLITFKFILKRKKSILGESFHIVKTKNIDSKLIIGSALFGIGWGTLGICPGPAIVNIVQLNSSIFLFILSMLAGMFIHRLLKL